MKRLLLIDNYDSFTWNLRQMLDESGMCETTVVKNDMITLNQAGEYDAILLSPGPGVPSQAGLICELISQYVESKPILGICLGHQAIAEVMGGRLLNLQEVRHGWLTEVRVCEKDPIFEGMNESFPAGLYHSWVVAREELPQDLRILALSDEGLVMALRYRTFPCYGFQFHPESIMTPSGGVLIQNWLKMI